MDERNEDYDIYGSFACVYDKFMDNVPYKEWGKYLKSAPGRTGYFRRAGAGAWMRHRKSDGDFSRCRIRHDRCGSVRRHA